MTEARDSEVDISRRLSIMKDIELPDRPGHPLRLLRFLLALLLLLPALLSGYRLHGPAALDVVLPFTAAVLAFPATRRRRITGIVLGALSAVLLGAANRNDAELVRVLMVTLAIVGFLAWARWAGAEAAIDRT